jgi:hypothetical protein
MKNLAALGMMATLLSAAPAFSQAALKKFEPPDSRLFTGGKTFMVKDEGCLKDYARALAMEGIQQRKALLELLTYHCAEPFGDSLV